MRAETEFHQELHAGDVVALESTLLRLGEKSATFHHRLRNVATNVLAMSTEFKCVLLYLEKRQTSPIPDDIRSAAIKVFSLEALIIFGSGQIAMAPTGGRHEYL